MADAVTATRVDRGIWIVAIEDRVGRNTFTVAV